MLGNLVDTEICIVSKTVLTMLGDDPTMENIKEEFIEQMNLSETACDRTQAYILEKPHYYARVNDPRTYQAITKDIITRKCAPLVVDSPVFNTKMSVQPFNKYLGKGVTKQISVKISDGCVIGEGTKIGTLEGKSKTKIVKSVIGKECTIGDGVSIRNCVIWDNVTIGDNCTIENALVCENVTIGSGVKIETGTMIDKDVKVFADVAIPENTVVSCLRLENSKYKAVED